VTSQGRPRRDNTLLFAGGAVALVLVAFLAYEFVLNLRVTVDGRDVRVLIGTRVVDVAAEHRAIGAPGDLVAAGDGKVLRKGAGAPGYTLVGDERVAEDARLFRPAAVRSVNGSDIVEPVGRRSQAIPSPVRFEGEGPIESVVDSGTPGLRNVYYGTVSKQVVRVETATAPTPRIVRLSGPPPGAKIVVLTFDDGPWPGSTQRILEILAENDVKATFFMLGIQAKSHPGMAKQVVAAGMELGNHSVNHPNLTKLSSEGIAKQIRGAQTQIADATGVTPKYFRPPGGNCNAAVKAELARDGLKLVQWDVDTEDWKKPGAGTIADRAVNHARPGAVILMHDGGGTRDQTISALPQIIRRLKAKGYTFVTLDYLPKLPGSMG
jgi:peptidoglycan/xylan/chitin deacetylase (PgdA/CDA1 family)